MPQKQPEKCCVKCILTPWGTQVLADGIPICYNKKCSCHIPFQPEKKEEPCEACKQNISWNDGSLHTCTKDCCVFQPPVSEWEKYILHNYQNMGENDKLIPFIKELIARVRNHTLEECAGMLEKQCDFDYSEGDSQAIKLKNHKELGIKRGLRKAVSIIRSLKTE